jgi:ribosome-interacting GTPase 1
MRMTLEEEPVEDEQGRVLTPMKALIAGNKVDLDEGHRNLQDLQEMYGARIAVITISSRDKTGLEELKSAIFQALDVIRVYTKSPGKKADFNDPIILDRGSTLEDAAGEVHKDFLSGLKYARVWGSGKHDGVMVKRDHVLHDGDVIELHI